MPASDDSDSRLPGSPLVRSAVYDRAAVGLWIQDLSATWDRFRALRASGVDDLGAWFEEDPGRLDALVATIRRGTPNMATCQMYGAANADDLRERAFDTLGRGTQRATRDFLEGWFDGDNVFSATVDARRLDGRVFHVRLVARAPRSRDEAENLVVALLDVTREVELQADLADETARLDELLRDADIGRWDFDIVDRRVRLQAPIGDLLGIPENVWIAEDVFREHLAGIDLVDADRQLERIAANTTDRLAFTVRTPHEPPMWFEIRGRVLRDEDGVPNRVIGLARDRTSETVAIEAAETATGAFDVAAAPQLLIDDAGVVLDANESFAVLMGRPRSALVGQPARVLRADRDRDDVYVSRMWPRLREGGIWSGRIPLLRADGATLDLHFVIRRLARRPDRTPRYLCSVVEGVTTDAELQARVAELTAMVHIDPLTGLSNRTALFERLRVELHAGRPTGVLFVDLDGFKAINDVHGHDVGDRALREIGQRLLHSVRGSDLVARLGGDEFVILMTDLDDLSGVPRVARRALNAIAEPLTTVPRRPQRVSASFGVAVSPSDGTEADTLLRHADTAMYRAKARGGGTWLPWNPGIFGMGSDTHAQLDDRDIDESGAKDA